MKKLSKILLVIIVFYTCVFTFISPVKAASNNCYYATQGTNKYYYKHAKLNLKNKKVTVRKVIGPDITAKKVDVVAPGAAVAGTAAAGAAVGSAIPVGGTIVGGIVGAGVGLIAGVANNILTSEYGAYPGVNQVNQNKTPKEYKVKNKKLAKKLKLFDDKGKEFKVAIPEINDSCTEYLGIVINDIAFTKNIQVVAVNEETKNMLDSYIEKYPDNNYIVWGTPEKSQAQNPDELGGEGPSEDYDTCDGLLGVRNADEYEEGSVGYLLQQIFDYMKIAVVVIIFGFSIKDYALAIASQDQDDFKKANTRLLKRLIIGVVFFLLPELVNLILDIIDSNTCGIQ